MVQQVSLLDIRVKLDEALSELRVVRTKASPEIAATLDLIAIMVENCSLAVYVRYMATRASDLGSSVSMIEFEEEVQRVCVQYGGVR